MAKKGKGTGASKADRTATALGAATEKQRILNREKAVEADIARSAKERGKAEKEALKYIQEQHKGYIDLYDAQTQSNLAAAKEYELHEANLKILKEKLEAEQEANDINAELLVGLKKQVQELEKVRDTAKATAANAKKMADAVDLSQKAAENALEQWFGINARAKEVGNTFLDNNGKVKIFNGFLSMTVKHMSQGVDKAALLGKYMLKAYESAKKVHETAKKWGQQLTTDPAKAALQYATDIRLTAQELGYDLDEMNSQIVKRSKEITQGYVITEAEARKTLVSMIRDTTRFTLVSDEQGNSIQRTATLLTRLGIDASTTGRVWDKLQTTFAKTPETAERITANITTLARHLKMDANQTMQMFNTTLDGLVAYGLPDAEKAFKRLAATQKMTGVETTKLLGAMDKWTTFEGATSAAGELNAVFGLNISSMKMMETAYKDPVEALMLLKEHFDSTGQSATKFDRGQRRIVGKLFGDEAMAIKLLSVNTEELRAAQEAAGGVTASVEEVHAKLNKTTKETTTLEQDAAKSIDKRRQAIQGFMNKFYQFQKEVNQWIAESPWLSMIGGLVLSTAGGMAQLALLWTTWKIKAIADASQVAAATSAAAGTTGATSGIGAAAKGGGMMMGLGKLGAFGAILYGGYKLAELGIESRMEADPESAWGAGGQEGGWVGAPSGQERQSAVVSEMSAKIAASYQEGGPITKEGFLTDRKGRPYARVHQGEHVIPDTAVTPPGAGGMPPVQLALNIALQMGDKVIATSEERIIELAEEADFTFATRASHRQFEDVSKIINEVVNLV
jgi:AraC-like DNA-binding protein